MSIIKKKKNNEIADKILRPFEEFFKAEASSSILLIIFTIAAIIITNTTISGAFFDFWNTYLNIGFGDFQLDKPLLLWINDGLMAVFFFFVGLEIKREIMVGELKTFKSAALPLFAAIGGMLVPALLYTSININNPQGASGWGIPMATDIAFALGILFLIGKKAPLSLRIFLAALAIVDDLGAVIVIAIFYTSQIYYSYLLIAAFVLILLFIINRIGVRHPLPFIILGVILWVLFLKSGIHATIAGVLLAITIPSKSKIEAAEFVRKINFFITKFKNACMPGKDLLENQVQQETLQTIEITCHHAESPMQRMEHDLQPFVAYFIIPLFALANAGMSFNTGAITIFNDVSFGIILGLVIGKPLGVFFFSFIAIKMGIARMPEGSNWGHIIGIGLLAGIGFTMSLFINSLAFDDPAIIKVAKIGIFAASIVSAIAGYIVIKRASRKST